VPDANESAPLEAVARACGAEICRGPENDLLARYTIAARAVNAHVIMRVTSDCPLIDPQICGSVLELRASEDADYVTNNMPPSFPHGLDCEAFTTEALAEADRSTREPYDREHVTPWLRRAPHLKRKNLHSGRAGLERHRWTVDYTEDLTFLRAVVDALPLGSQAGMKEVLDVLTVKPHLNDINASRRAASA
jgi:glutamate-1-semialdehyde 2,1-aminomutase/spore coat polysaccharide biosynthesis protein SpsF